MDNVREAVELYLETLTEEEKKEAAKRPLARAIDVMEIALPLDFNDMTVRLGRGGAN